MTAPAVALEATPPLEQALRNRRWVHRTTPFPHVIAQDVFTAEVYDGLHAQFERIQRERPTAFERNMGSYDAAAVDVGPESAGPMGLFVSRAWHDLVAGVAGVQPTGDVSATLHHHAPGSRGGWPHNDLNPGWFAGAAPPPPHRVQVQSTGGVHYQTGDRPAGIEARETVRAVSLLFYLGNPDWHAGEGGETALFTSYGSAPAALVPPVNNSLVMFECTPFSLHAFRGNLVNPRNSLVMWLHRPRHEAVRRWGEHAIVRW